MAKNSKRDAIIEKFYIVAIVLCALALIAAFVLNGISNGKYNAMRVNTHNVKSSSELQKICSSVNNDVVYLESDVTIENSNFRIGSDRYPFCGVFDGQGHTVQVNYSTVNAKNSIFGFIAEGGVVQNVNFVFTNVEVNGTTYGAIANINDGTIKDCAVSFETLKINEAGMFSPLVAVNRGNISNVVISSMLVKNVDALEEHNMLFGNACVYNKGQINNVIVTAKYQGWKSTDEFSVMKGLVHNNGISAVNFNDVNEGKTVGCVAITDSGVYTADRYSAVSFQKDPSKVFNTENIFYKMNFNNQCWSLVGYSLSLSR